MAAPDENQESDNLKSLEVEQKTEVDNCNTSHDAKTTTPTEDGMKNDLNSLSHSNSLMETEQSGKMNGQTTLAKNNTQQGHADLEENVDKNEDKRPPSLSSDRDQSEDNVIPEEGEKGGEEKGMMKEANGDISVNAQTDDASKDVDETTGSQEGVSTPADEINDTEDSTDNDSVLNAPPENLDELSRAELYEKGKELHKKGKIVAALKCFLRCLSGLENANGFAFLPQCLRRVADIYYTQEEYEKAIQFVQAEKLYYETALVDTEHVKKRLEEKQNGDSSKEDDTYESDSQESSPDLAKAEEYEGLAKMCLEREQPQLALEYQAKATKLKRTVLGEQHPLTQKSLDFFTIIYGEVGKHQYSESIQKLTVPVPMADPAEEVSTADAEQNNGDPSNLSTGLRKRMNNGKDTGNKGKAEQSDSKQLQNDARSVREREEWLSEVILMFLFAVCLVVLISSLVFLYCKIDTNNRRCSTWRNDLHYVYMKVKYWYYATFSAQDKQYG